MDLSVGSGRERLGMEEASILIKIFRKLTVFSVGAGREQSGVEKVSLLSELVNVIYKR